MTTTTPTIKSLLAQAIKADESSRVRQHRLMLAAASQATKDTHTLAESKAFFEQYKPQLEQLSKDYTSTLSTCFRKRTEALPLLEDAPIGFASFKKQMASTTSDKKAPTDESRLKQLKKLAEAVENKAALAALLQEILHTI